MNNLETCHPRKGRITWSSVLLIQFFLNQFSHEQLTNRKAKKFVH